MKALRYDFRQWQARPWLTHRKHHCQVPRIHTTSILLRLEGDCSRTHGDTDCKRAESSSGPRLAGSWDYSTSGGDMGHPATTFERTGLHECNFFVAIVRVHPLADNALVFALTVLLLVLFLLSLGLRVLHGLIDTLGLKAKLAAGQFSLLAASESSGIPALNM